MKMNIQGFPYHNDKPWTGIGQFMPVQNLKIFFNKSLLVFETKWDPPYVRQFDWGGGL